MHERDCAKDSLMTFLLVQYHIMNRPQQVQRRIVYRQSSVEFMVSLFRLRDRKILAGCWHKRNAPKNPEDGQQSYTLSVNDYSFELARLK